jgi:hypothetical protein
MGMRIRALSFAVLAVLATGTSCGITTPDLDDVGTVELIDIEGGCWVIQTSDAVYEPINLPSEMRTDGLSVSFEATERDDLASICQVGRIIELLRIQPTGVVQDS